MSQSLSRLWTHLIFSTRDRFPFLKEPGLKDDMHRYLASVLRSHDCETLIVGGTSDHMHTLFDLSRKYSVATIIKDISPSCKKFHWQKWLWGIFGESVTSRPRLPIY